MSQTLLHFPPLDGTLTFVDCDAVAQAFLSLLVGWDISPASRESSNNISFYWKGNRLAWVSDEVPPPEGWLRKPPGNDVDAACDLHYYLLDVFSDRHPGIPCIHAAAIEFEQGLVVMPSIQKTGKSTLTAELAARGQRVYCDDLLPLDLDAGAGIALGILPRLRLPLPDNASTPYRSFVEAHRGLSDDTCQYLALDDNAIAGYGEKLPVVGFVLLDRRAEGPVQERDESVAPVLARLIDRQFGGEADLLGMFRNMRRLVEQSQRLAVTFSSTSDLATTLLSRFGAGRMMVNA